MARLIFIYIGPITNKASGIQTQNIGSVRKLSSINLFLQLFICFCLNGHFRGDIFSRTEEVDIKRTMFSMPILREFSRNTQITINYLSRKG